MDDGSRRKRWIRLGILALVLVAIAAVASAAGVQEYLTPDRLRALLLGAGLCGVLSFLAAFAAGNLIQIPGWLFVSAGVVAWGGLAGGALALLGALLAVTVTFIVVRVIGGKAPEGKRRPLFEKLLGGLERRPVRTIVILRALFWMAPPLNYALALSRVRFRDYLVGSAMGLALPVAAMAVFVEAIGI